MGDSDLDQIVESILGRTLKATAKSRIKKIARTGLRKKPVQYPAGWTGEPDEKGGRFASKEDLAAARAKARGVSGARARGGARGRRAAEMDKEKADRAAAARAVSRSDGPGAMSRKAAKKALTTQAAKMEADRDAKRSEQEGGVSKAKGLAQDRRTKAQKAVGSKVEGFSAVRALMDRKLRAGGKDTAALTMIDREIANALNKNKGEDNPDAIKTALRNARASLNQRIGSMKGYSAAEKADLQRMVKELFAQAQSALDKDISEMARKGKGSGGKGATGRPTKMVNGKKMNVDRSGGTGSTANTPASSVGTVKRTVPSTAGTVKRKRTGTKLPGRASQRPETGKKDEVARLSPAAAAARGVTKRDTTAPKPFSKSDSPKKKTRKKMKESLVNDLVNEFFKSRDI